MTQGRIRLQTLIMWLALIAHCLVAVVVLVLMIGLASSNMAQAILMGVIFVVVLLPIVPSIRRAVIEESLPAAIKPSRGPVGEWMVVILSALGLPLLLFGWPDLVEPPSYLAGEDQLMDHLKGLSLVWLANVVRELVS
jgi:Na+/melibiose symporter-like transporter